MSQYILVENINYPSVPKNAKRSTTNWCFEKMLMNALQINTIWWKKLGNNCFGLKKLSTNLHQIKIGKQECHKIRAMLLLFYSTPAYLFSPDKDLCCIFLTWNICCKFLTSFDIDLQSVHRPSFYLAHFKHLIF